MDECFYPFIYFFPTCEQTEDRAREKVVACMPEKSSSSLPSFLSLPR